MSSTLCCTAIPTQRLFSNMPFFKCHRSFVTGYQNNSLNSLTPPGLRCRFFFKKTKNIWSFENIGKPLAGEPICPDPHSLGRGGSLDCPPPSSGGPTSPVGFHQQFLDLKNLADPPNLIQGQGGSWVGVFITLAGFFLTQKTLVGGVPARGPDKRFRCKAPNCLGKCS